MATRTNWLLDSYVYGFALQEASLPFDTADELADMAEDVFLPRLPPDEFFYLNESAAALVAAGYDPAEQFIFGRSTGLDYCSHPIASCRGPDRLDRPRCGLVSRQNLSDDVVGCVTDWRPSTWAAASVNTSAAAPTSRRS